MCGICGTVGFGTPEDVRGMAERLTHRGPDQDGFFDGVEPAVHLGNRRLSVIDVEGGTQPVWSEDRRVVAVQNGEIYNFRALRERLEALGHTFTSHTDTEVLPHLYQEYGEDFVDHLDGMFAVAIWDLDRKKLLLARDHVGIKPLYLWQQGSHLAFASEVKALLALDGVDARLDVRSLHFLMNVRFVPGSQTLFQGIRKLAPGTLLVWEHGAVRERRYWSLDVRPDRGIRHPADVADETRRLLARAVDDQLVADVPVGLYLSGGIDSSSLVAMAAGQRDAGSIKTFALGFGEPTDELEDAALVARAFGTDHRADTLTMDALSVFPTVTWHVEEPKENAIQLYLLAKNARQHVTVALSGLGGDELFAGYDLFDRLAPLHRVHPLARRARPVLDPAGSVANVLASQLGAMRLDLARRAMDFGLSAGHPAHSYALLRNSWEHDRRLFRAVYTPRAQRLVERQVEAYFTPWFEDGDADLREQVLRAELQNKLVDDFLMNEDRTSMASSLEVRVPFLDRRLVEHAFRIPARVHLHDGKKSVLRAAMADVLPAHTLRKKKWGFTFDPVHQFGKDLQRIARRELTADFLRRQDLFQVDFVHAILDHRRSRLMRWHYFLLWLILGLKLWQELFEEGRSVEELQGRFGG